MRGYPSDPAARKLRPMTDTTVARTQLQGSVHRRRRPSGWRSSGRRPSACTSSARHGDVPADRDGRPSTPSGSTRCPSPGRSSSGCTSTSTPARSHELLAWARRCSTTPSAGRCWPTPRAVSSAPSSGRPTRLPATTGSTRWSSTPPTRWRSPSWWARPVRRRAGRHERGRRRSPGGSDRVPGCRGSWSSAPCPSPRRSRTGSTGTSGATSTRCRRRATLLRAPRRRDQLGRAGRPRGQRVLRLHQGLSHLDHRSSLCRLRPVVPAVTRVTLSPLGAQIIGSPRHDLGQRSSTMPMRFRRPGGRAGARASLAMIVVGGIALAGPTAPCRTRAGRAEGSRRWRPSSTRCSPTRG